MTSQSYYEQNPEAFSEATKRKDFEDRLIGDLPILQSIMVEDVGNMGKRREIQALIERAWLATQNAARATEEAMRAAEAYR